MEKDDNTTKKVLDVEIADSIPERKDITKPASPEIQSTMELIGKTPSGRIFRINNFRDDTKKANSFATRLKSYVKRSVIIREYDIIIAVRENIIYVKKDMKKA